MTDFWRNWLRLWALGVALFGLVLAGAGLSATDGAARALLERMGGAPVAFDPPLRFAVALMGAVTLGWALTMLAAMRAAGTMGAAARRLWRGLLGAMLVWFAIDSALSIATGFTLNAVSNSLLLALFLWPLWRSGVLRDGAQEGAQSAARAPQSSRR